MHNARSNTPYDSDLVDSSINESFLKSDIANVISKMYTPRDRTPENLTTTEDLCKVDQSRRSELDEIPTKEVGYIYKSGNSAIYITPVVDSSTSDSVSLPRGKNELKSSRVICECCRRKISSRVVEKRVKIACSGCQVCMKHECFHSVQTKGKFVTGAQCSQHNEGHGDCNSSKNNCATSHYNHLKNIHEDCAVCKSNLQSMKMHEHPITETPLPENVSNLIIKKVKNVHNASGNLGTTEDPTNITANPSKNIKSQHKSLLTILKSCVNKEEVSLNKSSDIDGNDQIGDLDKTKTIQNLEENDGRGVTSKGQECDLTQAEVRKASKQAEASSGDTVVEIRDTENETKSSIKWDEFWFELFKPARQVLAFFSAFILTLLEFFLDSLVRPLLWGTVQTVSTYFFRPCLDTVFHSVLDPVFVLLTNIASSTRDLFLPVAQCFGYFLKEFATGCRACRMAEEPKANITPEEIVSKD